jgi:dienelactone hydrolase
MKMLRIFRLLLSCLIALSIPVASYAADHTEIRERLSKHYRLEKPEGPGPFPAVLLVPGCRGFDAKSAKARYDRVQRRLVELGFVTLRLNYLAVRNASSCWPDVPTEDVAGDICIAANYLRQRLFVKKGAINVLGWSWGGASALMALGRTKNREPAQVDTVVVYFPPCNVVKKWDSEVPVLALFGAIDNIAPFSDCKSLFAHLPKPHKVTVRVYDDAYHGFDNSDLPKTMQRGVGTFGYNEAAAKSAWLEVSGFLRR